MRGNLTTREVLLGRGLAIALLLQGCLVQCGPPHKPKSDAGVDAGPTGWREQLVEGNDHCDQAFPIHAPGGNFDGDTTGATDDGSGACAEPGVPDEVYQLSSPSPFWLRAGINQSGFNGALHLHRDTCMGPEVACETVPASFGTPAFSRDLDGGQYFLFADGSRPVVVLFGYDGVTGYYQLEVVQLPILNASGNDSCEQAIPLDPVGNSIRGNLEGMRDDVSSSCAPGGRDVAFRLQLATRSVVRMSLDEGDVAPSIAIRQGSCTGAEVGCWPFSRAKSNHWHTLDQTLEAGTYFVILDESPADPDGGYPYSHYQFDLAVSDAP